MVHVATIVRCEIQLSPGSHWTAVPDRPAAGFPEQLELMLLC